MIHPSCSGKREDISAVPIANYMANVTPSLPAESPPSIHIFSHWCGPPILLRDDLSERRVLTRHLDGFNSSLSLLLRGIPSHT